MEISTFHWSLERSLQLLGFWPNKSSLIAQFILCSSTVLLLPFQLWDAYNVFDNPPLMISGLNDFITVTLLLIKFFVMWYNQSYIYSLIEEIAEDWVNLKSSIDRETMLKYLQYAHKICVCDYSLYFTCIAFYYLESLLSYVGKPVQERQLAFKLTYPFDYRPSPFFEIATILQGVQILLMICANASTEIFLGTLVCHAAGRIDILVCDIKTLSVNCNSISNRQFLSLMKKIVSKHRRLIDMHHKIEAIYSYVCLSQVFSSTLVICLAGFVILNSLGTKDLVLLGKLITFIVLMLWQAFAFCFAGEFLKTKNSSILESIYNCSWYELTPKNVKLLIVIMMKCQEPLQLTVGKFIELSIGTFVKIVKTSASYLSVLRAMY